MEALLDEVESLEAIMMNDVDIQRNPDTDVPESIETTILPIVDEDAEEYVRVTLQVILVPGYPDTKPLFKLKNSRGLSDSSLSAIEKSINEKLDENAGMPVCFDLIEVVREHLTERNVPSGQCVVCLYGFHESDQFIKTVCYHYLHTYCLARHLQASKRNFDEEFAELPEWQQKTAKPYQSVCPVCRESIDYDVEPLLAADPPNELENAPDFELTRQMKELQAKFADLYIHQKERGGIIDVDAEEGPVISIDDGSTDYNQSERNSAKDVVKDHEAESKHASATAAKSKHAKANNGYQQSKNHHSHHKKHGGHKEHHYHHRRRNQIHHLGEGCGSADQPDAGGSSSRR